MKNIKRKIVNFAFYSVVLLFVSCCFLNSRIMRNVNPYCIYEKNQCHVSIFNRMILFFFLLLENGWFCRIFISLENLLELVVRFVTSVDILCICGALGYWNTFRIGLLCKKKSHARNCCADIYTLCSNSNEMFTFKRTSFVHIALFFFKSRCFCCLDALNTSRQTSESNAPQF